MTTDISRSQSGLGRGLAALIPQREESSPATDLAISAIEQQPVSASPGSRAGRPRGALGEHRRARRASAHPGDADRRLGIELIAGERRLRAAEMAGLERIPAVVRTATETEQLQWALIENLQRSDLNSMEAARAFQRLIDEFGLTHEDIAQRMGRARSTSPTRYGCSNWRPRSRQQSRAARSPRGTREPSAAWLDHELQRSLLSQVIARAMSVRQTEEMVRRARAGALPVSRKSAAPRRPTWRGSSAAFARRWPPK